MKQTHYKELASEVKGLIDGVCYPIANYANVSAAIWQAMDAVNWVGVYLLENDKLVLGPFQGNPACVTIPHGSGVCGTALKEKRTLVVPDVHQFPGHIACDPVSRSEIVIPIIKNGIEIGVLDIDSPLPGRFDEHDRINLEMIVSLLVNTL